MLKRIVKILIPILIIVGIILFVWWITDPSRENITHTEKTLVELNIEGINNSEYGIYNILKIDNENYILITRQLALDENNLIIPGMYNNYYTIYKYNVNTGIQQPKLDIDEYFQVSGIDINKKVLYLAMTNLEIPEGNVEAPYSIVKVNYETMEIESILNDKSNFYSCIISKNADVWTYLVNGSLYMSNANFENEKLLLDSNGVTMYSPNEIIGDKIIYSVYGEEQDKGIGAIDASGKNQFVQIAGAFYIGYNQTTNDIYYMENEILNKLMKVNLDTLEKTVALEFEISEKTIFSYANISSDMKYVAVMQSQYAEGIENAKVSIYDLTTKQFINEYQLENTGNLSNIQFLNNSIIFTQNNKLYKWNYLEKK